jgi:hypothetical protein
VTIVVTPTAIETVCNTAFVTADQTDPAPLNDEVVICSAVDPIPGDSNLGIVGLEAPDVILVGVDQPYTLMLTNSGPDATMGVTLSSTIPPDLDIVSIQPSQGSCTVTNGMVTCDLGSVSGGAGITIEVIANAATLRGLCVTGSVSGLVADVDPSDNVIAECAGEELHDLAIISLKPPKNINLKAASPALTQRVMVQIQNRSTHDETIPDLATLSNLVTVAVESLGTNCPAPEARLIPGPPNVVPRTIKPKGKLNVFFEVTFDCANDPLKGIGHEDFKYTATVHHDALPGGAADVHHADDTCPRPPLPGGVDTFPDGKIKDKGCGGKNPDGTLGADVKTDVVRK